MLEIGRKYIWELYPNLNRFQYNLKNSFLLPIPLLILNFIKFGHTYLIWSTKYMKSAENIYGSYIQIWIDFNKIWQIYFCTKFSHSYRISLASDMRIAFGVSNIWNRPKIYMGAIFKSEPISISFDKFILYRFPLYIPNSETVSITN